MANPSGDLAAFLQARLDEDARHDPERVLREVEAVRAILAEHERIQGSAAMYPNAANAAALIAAQRMVRHLAAVYSDHPDYRQEWRT